MGIFTDISTAILSQFESQQWKDTEIKTYPQNYQGSVNNDQWIRVNVFADQAQEDQFGPGQRNDGFITVNIFVKNEVGTKFHNIIADELNSLLLNKTFSGIQVTKARLTSIGVDPKSPGLFQMDWEASITKY